jgi:hypothetical protein
MSEQHVPVVLAAQLLDLLAQSPQLDEPRRALGLGSGRYLLA